MLAAALALVVAAAPAGAVSHGKKEAIANAPYVAWLPSGCTGTLIAPDRVLTAGHCLEGFSPLGFAVIVGKDGNSLFRPGTDRFAAAIANGGIPARAFAINPKFKESFPFAHRSPQNAIAQRDVGLILLDHPVTGVTPVKVAGAGDRAAEKPGETASILGYGLTRPSVLSIPNSLRTGHMTVLTSAACKQAYPRAIIRSEICGQDLKTKHAPLTQACAGDSGGPFIRQTSQGPVQIGITSWGPEVKDAKCGHRHLPGVFMRTSSFSSFINAVNPVIQPFPAAPLTDLASTPTVAGIGKVGQTLTCNPPAFAGSPSTLSYQWIFNRKTVSRTPTLKVTKPMIGHFMGCNVTARNASGHFQVFTAHVNRVRVTG
jgi:Trypsin